MHLDHQISTPAKKYKTLSEYPAETCLCPAMLGRIKVANFSSLLMPLRFASSFHSRDCACIVLSVALGMQMATLIWTQRV